MKSKKTRKITNPVGVVGNAIWIVGTILIIYNLPIFWFRNPELTQIQVFIENWKPIAASYLIIVLGVLISTWEKPILQITTITTIVRSESGENE